MPGLSLLSAEEICRKLKPILGKKIDELYLNYTLADSRDARYEIEQMLNILYRKHLAELLNEDIILEPPTQDEVHGEYPLGVVHYAGKGLYNFNLREEDWIRHVCITGMSGSGKTNLAFYIIKNFIDKDKNFWIFDWKKSFRPLILANPEIKCFTVGNEKVASTFKININRPPKGVGPKEWMNLLCDLITETFNASFGVHKLISETMDEAFKEAGVYRGTEDYPTWHELWYRLNDKLKTKRGREANWLESALRVAHVLTFGDFGKVINCKGEDSLSVEDLLDQKVIFEMSSLSNTEKTFFCSFLLAYIHKLKKTNQEGVDERFNHAILVDEAHNIFLNQNTNFVKESVTDTIYREIREYGVSLICLDQHISKLSSTIVGNSACHIAFQQQLPEDIRCIARVCQLHQNENYFSKLGVGEVIVKLAEHYHQPFLVKVPLSELKNQKVSDSMIKEKMSYYNEEIKARKDKDFMGDLRRESEEELDHVQRLLLDEVNKRIYEGQSEEELKEFFDEMREHAKENEFNDPTEDIKKVMKYAIKKDVTKEEQNVYKAPNISNDEIKGLDENEETFLKFLQESEEDYSTTEVYRELGLSARKGNNVKNKLLEKNLIEIKEERNETGRKKIIQLA